MLLMSETMQGLVNRWRKLLVCYGLNKALID